MSLPATILIVDDTEHSRYVHARYLRRAGFIVMEAATGTKGLELAPRADAILLDVRLPDINGLDVCRRLKTQEPTASIPVLQTSASFVSVTDKVLGLQGGADAYLTVPIEPTELIATLNALLRLRRAETQARRRADEWGATFDAISDGICLLDNKARVVRCNRALRLAFADGNASPESASPHARPDPPDSATLGDRPLCALLGVDRPAELRRFLAEADDQPKDFSAGSRWLRLRAHPVPDVDCPGRTVCVVSDITRLREVEDSLRQAEAELAAHASTLEKRVEERTRELHARNRELEAFTYSVSHDLRAPLRTMHTFAGILIEELEGRVDEERIDYLRRIEAAAVRMDRLTGDLLHYSQLSRAEMSLRPVRTGELLRRIVRTLVSETGATPDAFTLEEPLNDVLANTAVLEQSLINLLGNAVKFARQDTPLSVRCFTEKREDRVRLTLADNGIGIEARYLERIFQPFEKLHSPAVYAGTGIGLAIVQRGMERMGGRVGVESTPGHGSSFWLELPAA